MTRSIFPPILLAVWSAIVLLAACGGSAEDENRIAQLEESFAEELRLLREEVAAAKLNPNDKVHIVLAGSGATTKLVKVDPEEKRVCKHPEANCGRQVRWILQGAIPQDWYVKITQKSDYLDCFAEPAPLKRGHTSEPSNEPAPDCQLDGIEWGYTVTLYDGDDGVKGVIDPLVIVNWSP